MYIYVCIYRYRLTSSLLLLMTFSCPSIHPSFCLEIVIAVVVLSVLLSMNLSIHLHKKHLPTCLSDLSAYYPCSQTCTCIYIYIHKNLCRCVHGYMCVCLMNACVYVCIYMYIDIQICILRVCLSLFLHACIGKVSQVERFVRIPWQRAG